MKSIPNNPPPAPQVWTPSQEERDSERRQVALDFALRWSMGTGGEKLPDRIVDVAEKFFQFLTNRS